MPKIHCHNCAKQLESFYKFCPFCSVSLSSLSNKPEPPQEKPKPNFVLPTSPDDEADDDDVDSVQSFNLRINSLAFDVNNENANIERMSFLNEQNATKRKRGRPSKS